jgi:uncharacterized membrane protein YfcA
VSELVIVLVLSIVAGILAGVELARTRGQDLISWAVLLLAVALIVRAV